MADQENQNQQQQLNIELPEDIAQGIYANLAVISHSSAEFVVDYIRLLPGLPQAKVQTRIILAPQHAKRLLMALQDNIRKYENQYGEIEIHNQDVPAAHSGMTFGGPAGEA